MFFTSPRVSRPAHRARHSIVCVTAVAVAAGLLQAVPSPAQAVPGDGVPQVQTPPTKPAPALPAPPVRPRNTAALAAAAAKPPTVTWPTPGAVEVTVPSAPGQPSGSTAPPAKARAGGLPVGVAPVTADAADRAGAATAVRAPAKVRLETLDRAQSAKAKVDGPLVRLSRTDGVNSAGKVRLSLDYAGYAGAYGGDFGGRLQVVRLPECALSTPDAPQCAPQPLRTTNDTARDTLTVEVLADGQRSLLGITATDSSAEGNYATPAMTASSKWNVAPSSGAFTWSYPLRVPPAPGGQAPAITLGYNSQTADGRTTTTNNQGSWLGEGFSYEPGYVERRYKPCQDDGHPNVGDLCWSHDNAMLSLNGSSRELVRDGNSWRFSNDDGSTIERFTGAANGDNNGEHWKVTTIDGTQFFFGLNRLPGWNSGNSAKDETASAWTVPVFGDDKGEECNKASFEDSHCQQGWRWNLDYVKDRHGNVSSYFYQRETNHYALGRRTDVDGAEYHRGGWLQRIDYGQRDGSVYSTSAPARVNFYTAERCIPTGTQACRPGDLNANTASAWPDVPWERNCAARTRCKSDQVSPTFWTRQRLVEITTEIRAGQGWTPVDTWALDHLLTNNDESYTLWLKSVVHKGRFGGGDPVPMPSVELLPIQRPNRVVSPGERVAALIRPRLQTVYTDSGGQITVEYDEADCAAGSLPTPGNSTRRCFPVKWHPRGEKDPVTDWFHKYVVKRITESDRTTVVPGVTRGAEMVTEYEYLNDAAWRHAEPDGLGDPDYQSWSEWRGYKKVRVRRGASKNLTTLTEHTYLRGMHGDRNPAGGTRTITGEDSVGVSYTDHDEFAGFEIETAVYDGAKVISKSTTSPWRYETASHKWDWGTDRAFIVRPEATRSFTALEGGGWRETKSITTYDPRTSTYPDPVGRVTRVEDLGDVKTAADDRCTRTFYADNTNANLRSLVSRVETVSVNCSTTPDRKTQVISDNRTWYDGGAFGAQPTKGDPTRTEKLSSHDGTTPTYVTAATGTFDPYGRPKTATDAAGWTTSMGYTEVDGLTTKRVDTSPRVTVGMVQTEFTATTEYAPAWGQPYLLVDWDGKRTQMEYDKLGRVTNVWLADRPRRANTLPSIKYTYKVQDNAPVAVKTEKLKNSGEYVAEYQIYDGFLRPRQVQTEGPDNGRLVAETYYTPTGQVDWTNDTFYAVGKPSDELLPVATGLTRLQTKFEYDGADRVKKSMTVVSGVEKWHTGTTYGGDRTHVDPPKGGIPTTTITDARGQVTQLLQYKGEGPSGDSDRTTYTYTPAGQLDIVKDPAGNPWNYDYDQLGRKVRTVDPDAGESTSTYNDLDQLVTTKDARGVTITHAYDPVGRKTATYDGPVEAGKKLASWTWDEGNKGQLYSSSRHVNGHEYKITTTLRDALYRVQRTEYSVPEVAGAEKLAGKYRFATNYNTDGTVQGIQYPEGGGLSPEGAVYKYDDLQRVTNLIGVTSYFGGTKYGETGELQQVTLSAGGRKNWATYEYETGTQRLKRARVSRQQTVNPGDPEPTEPPAVFDQYYQHDDAGNVLSIADKPAGGRRDIQCFEYDYLRRMTEAWATEKEADDPCAGGAGAAQVGGPAPYHHSYTYDLTGNRKTETQHAVAASTKVSRTYHYPKAESKQPHRLDSVTETTTAGDRLYSYEYNDAGSTTKRSRAGVDQTLDWDAEGHLASVTEAGKTTSFLYTADGDRLLRKEPTATTLYLPGMELRLEHAGDVVNGTRYYPVPDGSTVVRTIAGMQIQMADHHGTGQVAIDPVSGEVTQRRFTPFGVARGAPSTPGKWVGEKGFVGGTTDSTTGLTHLGAREYDPQVGRFISVDPLIDVADPQQMHGYAYANNSPASFSDATGLSTCSDDKCGAGADFEDAAGKYHEVAGHNDGCGGCSNTKDPHAGRKKGGGLPPELVKAKRDVHESKQTIASVAEELKDILAEELGIKDAVDCFTTGAFGACAETFMNVAGSFVGGLLLKVVRKYGFRWGKAADLIARLKNLGGKLIAAVSKWWNSSKTVKALESGCLVKGHSFAPGTLVVLADGSRKRIEDVDIGDQVLATDPESDDQSSKAAKKTVVATIIGWGIKHLVKITVDVDGKAGTKVGKLVATDNHPFWVPELGKWLDARDLKAGQWLQTSAGTRVQVTAVKRWTQIARVHNLTIRDIPTYYVLAGKTPVLVHNCGNSRFEVDSKGSTTDLSNPNNTRVGVPKLEGGTLQEVGGRIWGNGDPSALVGARGADELRNLASKADAGKLQDFYRSAELAGKGGKTAPARVQLTQEIIDAWGG